MENILVKINQAGLKLLETLHIDETYSTIVNEAMELVDADYGTIMLMENDALVRVFASDPNFQKIAIRKDGIVKSAYKKNKIIVYEVDALGKYYSVVKEMGIQSIILVPLSYHGKPIGVLSIHSKKREHFNEQEVNILRLFGSMASLAIKKSQLYDEQKKALEIRDMFISMAAHELRTPLTSISGYIQLLYSKLATKDGVEGKWIQELYEENKRMTALVKELLEVNRLKTGQILFAWQECALVHVLKDSLREVQCAYADRMIQFDNKLSVGEDKIIGDPSKLTQVFVNIIDNAMKYSPKSTKVYVTIFEKSGVLVIRVKDHGRGIEEEDMPHIFLGHHKGYSGEEGMGIGLFFVENVIRQHRGSIQVKSKLNKGTTIEVRLPKARYSK